MRQSPARKAVAVCVLLVGLHGCSEPPPDVADDLAAAESDTAPLPPPETETVHIDDATAGWLDTGIEISAGDAVALFASGDWEVEGLKLAPRHMLWFRLGADGTATQFRADQEVIESASGGPLFLTLRPPGVYWEDARGTYSPAFSQAPPMPVHVSVDVARLSPPVREGLQHLAARGDAASLQALAVLDARRPLPEGFFHLPVLGRSDVWFENAVDGRSGIRAETSDDVGIVKLPIDVPLDNSTELRFDWRYDALPALGPETEAQNHDYLSIALEFDNGQDLTWMWSPYLEAGTHFACPLPWWDARETHYVIQSGHDGLGKWFSHRRNVLTDYRESIALPEPRRVVGVWFIANSLFGRQLAAASFANVSIIHGNDEVVVFGD